MDPLRHRLLDEATRQFVERGFDGASMREIADACGVTKAALYYHYAGKADMLRDIVDGYLAEVADVVAAAVVGGSSPRDQLRAVVRGLFALPAQRRAVMRLAMHDLRHLPAGEREAFGSEYHERFIGPLTAVVQAGMDAGEFRQRDARVVVWLLLGMLYPFFSHQGEDSVVDELLEVLFEGL